MYGMLLESIQSFIQSEYGTAAWRQVVARVGCPSNFNTLQIYDDRLIQDLAAAASELLNPCKSSNEFMTYFGRCFVRFFTNFGYQTVVRATGRYFTEFLQNVDNIHLEMRFTYRKMNSPSMYITETDKDGAVLVYRSSRAGFKHYFLGQLQEIAESLYGIELKINVLEELTSTCGFKNITIKLRLDYDNKPYIGAVQASVIGPRLPPVSSKVLVDLFPFTVVFGRSMRVLLAGHKLLSLFPGIQVHHKPVTNFLKVRRPRGIPFTWENITCFQTVMFEVEVIMPEEQARTGVRKRPTKNILLKGQMKHIESISAIIFLCSPVVINLDDLQSMSLYLDDLNMHGLGRELVLRGWSNCSRLEQTCEEVEDLCKELEMNHKLLEEWKEKGDNLLYSMIPRKIADQLRAGASPLSTCKSFESVTVMFAELCGLKSAVTVSDVMTVVNIMNALFSCFDTIIDEFSVYKVETIGEVYMAVAGAPEESSDHADEVGKLCLKIIEKSGEVDVPLPVSVRIGLHTGPVVGGVVGTKLPRYCLFGDTVNTAARMQTNSEPGKIHISTTTKDCLDNEKFIIKSRGEIIVKGKGVMETHWLLGLAKQD
ncbi:soluble guanylate cyclase 89Da-like isoform X2 [Cimex lectularius]|uniref:guanylate cyclase n=1 Tax=Cimex lectularius TaxID=79782 RepID=A0A8I6RZI4_CIMLE|nr:soluble guanylate cyclase 89Da-like isoform X2 [Cimex lectularius]